MLSAETVGSMLLVLLVLLRLLLPCGVLGVAAAAIADGGAAFCVSSTPWGDCKAANCTSLVAEGVTRPGVSLASELCRSRFDRRDRRDRFRFRFMVFVLVCLFWCVCVCVCVCVCLSLSRFLLLLLSLSSSFCLWEIS